MDELYGSEAMAGHKVSVLAAVIDGSNPATHYVVEEFEDHAAYETMTAQRSSSPEWSRFQNATRGTTEYLGSTLQIQRYVQGGDWRDHDALVVFNMTISDPATFLEAFAELNSAAENPGSIRVNEIRAGGMGATHLVGATAEGIAVLNDALDETFGSDAFRTYVSKVDSIRTVNTTSIFRRVRTYGD